MGTILPDTTGKPTDRLYFIDAMRAFAILMMLQGHFIHGLLDEAYRDADNLLYQTWLYGRGITAPLFFTVSGFIFLYLLTRKPYPKRLENPRVRKGIKRGLQLIGIGYLLRLNVVSVFMGTVNPGFWLVDVLQCMGLGLLFLVAVYLLSWSGKGYGTGFFLLIAGSLVFLFQPVYAAWDLTAWPEPLANYFTRAQGSVFTLLPWLGYTAWGAFWPVFSIGLNPRMHPSGGWPWLLPVPGWLWSARPPKA